jgi:hypothetical protein
MLPELTQDEFSAALDAVAGGVLDAAGQHAPPIDAVELARALGLALAWDTDQPGRGRVVRLSGFSGTQPRGSILLRPEPRRERLQWATAHEIGETCACQVFDHLGIDPREAPSGAREMVANQLAGRLLLPREAFVDDGRNTGWDLFELKSRYATASHELIARRMLDFEWPIIITVFDHGRRTWRKGNLGRRPPALLPLEMAARLAAHERGEPIVEETPLCRVQAWPVHEPQWKREILRTEWQADDGDGPSTGVDDCTGMGDAEADESWTD